MGFIVKLVLVLAVVAGGVWAYMTFLKPAPASAPVTQVTPAPSPTPEAPKTPAQTISVSGSSDAALQGDLQTMDAQVQSAQDASAAADSSFSDQPIKQTE